MPTGNGYLTKLVQMYSFFILIISTHEQELPFSCVMPSLQIGASNATSITIEWSDPPCTAPVTHYLVIYGPQGCCFTRSDTVDIDQTAFTVNFLIPNTSYEFEVSLVNGGEGVWASSRIGTKTADIPLLTVPTTPILNLGDLQPTSIELSWNQPDNDVVNFYEISYRRIMFCASAPPGNRTINGHIRRYILTGLEENIGYEISIQAFGFGPSGVARATFTTLATVPSCCVPTPDVSINSETSVTVSWEREHCLLRNGQPREYILRYGLLDSNVTTTIGGIYPYSPGNHLLTSLRSNSWYIFEVALVNEVGTGPYSINIRYTGSASASQSPSTPIVTRISEVQSTSLTLTWRASLMTDVVDYHVINYYRIGGCGTTFNSVVSLPGAYTSWILTDLEENTVYAITLTTANTVGFSTSQVLTSTTGVAVPSCCVPGLQLEFTNITSFTVSWQQESCPVCNGRPISYLLRYHILESSAEFLDVSIPLHGMRYTANLLYPRMAYSVQVALVNEVGRGEFSFINVSTSSPTESGILLNGNIYSNHSMVDVNHIESQDNALICYTPFMDCCHDKYTSGNESLGDWYLPNGNIVGSRRAASVYRTRGASAILLHRNGNQLVPNGMYRCSIPIHNTTTLADIYIGVYPENLGAPVISSLTYNHSSGILTCESTGGPATMVTWNRMGNAYQQSQRIVNMSLATYHNYLQISSHELADYLGTFLCTVRNSRGESSSTIELSRFVLIAYNHSGYQHGSSATVACSSVYKVKSIQWRNTSTNEILSRTTEDTLDLVIHNISSYSHGTVYTCIVQFFLPSGAFVTSMDNFTIKTTPGKVQIINITSPDYHSLEVTWAAPALFAEDFLSYNVSVLLMDSTSHYRIGRITIQNTTLLATRLSEGVPYNISISAINSVGIGETKSLILFTREQTPAVAPKNVSASWNSPLVVRVRWSLLNLSEARGQVISYTVAYTSMTTGMMQQQPFHEFETDGDINAEVDLKDLNESTSYLVQMWASTRAGPGQTSPVILVPPLSTSRLHREVVSVVIGGCAVSLAGIVTFGAVVIFILVGIRKCKRNKKKSEDVELKSLSKKTESKCESTPSPVAAAGQDSDTNKQVAKETDTSFDHEAKNYDDNDYSGYFPLKPTEPMTSYYETINIKS